MMRGFRKKKNTRRRKGKEAKMMERSLSFLGIELIIKMRDKSG